MEKGLNGFGNRRLIRKWKVVYATFWLGRRYIFLILIIC